MSKKGILTKEEEKFFGKLIADEIHVEGIWSPIVKWTLPMLISAVDNNVGDNIPEPWQTHAERLTTMIHVSMQDKIITKEEQEDIINYTAIVINAEVDIPLLDEEQEALTFITLLKFLASVIRKWVTKATVVEG